MLTEGTASHMQDSRGQTVARESHAASSTVSSNRFRSASGAIATASLFALKLLLRLAGNAIINPALTITRI
jgi:hypothetical protein